MSQTHVLLAQQVCVSVTSPGSRLLKKARSRNRKGEMETYNAARPISPRGFLWSLIGQWSPPTRCLVFPPLHVLPSGETRSTRCLFTFLLPHSLQTSYRRSVAQLNLCCPHVRLRPAHSATSMTVVFCCWRPTGRGKK